MRVEEVMREVHRGRELFDEFCSEYPFSAENRYVFLLRDEPEWLEAMRNSIPALLERCYGTVYVFGNASDEAGRVCPVEMSGDDVWAMARYIQAFSMYFWWRRDVPFVFLSDWNSIGMCGSDYVRTGVVSPEEYVMKAMVR